ncbi:NTP transferase domain-containing protein [Candidatus Peregrinibacteria bacterium]|jgi:glucose-1-phosphate thymidylyltransferase|nr:NTP transferase domain-containing protein [Candidatus Peregrinibacteria bacterium]MBT5468413.1 NTP transferase domain-containing protein [Candidatus Peregrinibacteria bacterium]MBT7337203.1 NTP transferase domain-containing protein [Candidatus Peregrinibacteria bacterium]
MKGVLICGGTGSRLAPLTDITNKSLLPVYNKPLIHYPLQILLDAGIKDIIIISGTEHIDQIAEYLGSGSKFGCTFTFKVQEKAGGIAQALGLAADEFDDGESVCAILGDNIYFDDLSAHIQSFNGGGHVFLKEVDDPNRFGIAELSDGKVVSVEEKPSEPKSNLAITGCYIYDNRCFEIIKNMKPSARGEFEITDVTDWYLQHGELTATTLKEDWIDAGTFESLFLAASKVRDQNNS